MVNEIKGGKSLIDRLKEDNSDLETENPIKQKNKSISNSGNSSVIEKMNQTLKTYKRVGVDMDEEIDDAIEDLVNNELKDIATKKDLYNEAMALGWPIWLKQYRNSKKN